MKLYLKDGRKINFWKYICASFIAWNIVGGEMWK